MDIIIIQYNSIIGYIMQENKIFFRNTHEQAYWDMHSTYLGLDYQ